VFRLLQRRLEGKVSIHELRAAAHEIAGLFDVKVDVTLVAKSAVEQQELALARAERAEAALEEANKKMVSPTADAIDAIWEIIDRDDRCRVLGDAGMVPIVEELTALFGKLCEEREG